MQPLQIRRKMSQIQHQVKLITHQTIKPEVIPLPTLHKTQALI